MRTFEESLGDRLKSTASATRVPPHMEALIEARGGKPRRRGSGGRQVAAIAAAVLLLAGTVVLIGRTAHAPGRPPGHRPSLGGPASRGEAAAGWHTIAPAPVPARTQYEAVWTGKEMIVWGGYAASGNVNDGASYDPSTNSWKVMAPSPLAPRSGTVGVWTGSKMLVFGGSADVPYANGAAYVPATNSWRRLARIPASLGGNLTSSGSYAVWTGSRMLVWGFFGTGGGAHGGGAHGGGAHGGGSLRAASYDPATNTWSKGTAAPTEAPLFGDAFWTGSEMIVWGQRLVEPARTRRTEERADPVSTDFGISYDPRTGEWHRLPAAPLRQPGLSAMLAVWTGSELVVGGGELAHGMARDAAAFHPSSNTWSRLPNAPVGFTGNDDYPDVWTGRDVISFEDGVSGGRPLMLVLPGDTWRLGPPAPVPGRVEAEELWTGKEVLVWGGGTGTTSKGGGSCCTTVPKGYSYSPPAP